MKKKYFSAFNDYKSGVISKISIILGLVLLFVYIILKILGFLLNNVEHGFIDSFYSFLVSGRLEVIAAFSVLLLAAGIIFYFFKVQFTKLADIAKDVENGEFDEVNSDHQS